MKIFLDPSYSAYYGDKLFDLSDPHLNRDDVLMPFARLRNAASEHGMEVHTADLIDQGPGENSYYSFGLLERFRTLQPNPAVRLKGFFLMEPPVVAPQLYAALPELTAAFDSVYVHNTTGDGYSLQGVDRSRLRKFYWPQPYDDVLPPFWGVRNRQRRVVVINGNHKPASRAGELYSRRIRDMAALSQLGVVDLYGRGWERWWSRVSWWWPYWRNRRAIASIYKGACRSKFEVLSQYAFSLCYENMSMTGYMTEKLFDCLYCGTVPIYLGPQDIEQYVPMNVYIDARRFASMPALWQFLRGLSEADLMAYREAGRDFIRGAQGRRFVDSLSDLIINEQGVHR